MCGVAGIVRRNGSGVAGELLARMAAALEHRGPDGFGLFVGARVGLAHTRLSIIDLASGAQPMTNEDGSIVVTYNGEVYNYLELRDELRSLGHHFRTNSDTEVLVHGWEEWGEAMLGRLNGQFAFALYDRRAETVFLARDRFGVRPLFYAERGGDLYFASEMKALFATGEVSAAPDPLGLDQVFTFWGARAPRTPFLGVSSLEPGCSALWRNGRLTVSRYYDLRYPEGLAEPAHAIRTLDELMHSGVSWRMRADVPVGGYLSGGLDSNITCTLASEATRYALRTFSVTFDDPALDESEHQHLLARSIRSLHNMHHVRRGEIADVFPDVVRHAETPLVRTAPAPMYLLARLTRASGIKVVLTGEGADELFLGYDLFKEVAVRLFCLRQPESRIRPRLFDRLYPYLARGGRAGDFWRRFFLNAGDASDPIFSHLPRFLLTSRIKHFYTSEMRDAVAGTDPLEELRDSLPDDFAGWSPLNRAAYLEMTTLLSPYLLSAQGDRMAMAHGVEGRFPFLDHRLFEFAAALPTGSKLLGLREKNILRRWASDLLPAGAAARPKQPYRAPDIPAFLDGGAPEYVREALGPSALRTVGIFDPSGVAGLVRRGLAGLATGFAENQAFVAILSTQLWHREFCTGRAHASAAPLGRADVLIGDDLALAV